jgi:hypothetical protein
LSTKLIFELKKVLEKKERQALKHAYKTLTFKIEINEKSRDGVETSNDTSSKIAIIVKNTSGGSLCKKVS